MLTKASSVADKRSELRALNAEIAKRRAYYNQQERLIKDLVESGNTQLMGLHHDIFAAKQELRNIKTDIRMAVREKVLLNEDLSQIRTEISLTVVQTTFIGFAPAY